MIVGSRHRETQGQTMKVLLALAEHACSVMVTVPVSHSSTRPVCRTIMWRCRLRSYALPATTLEPAAVDPLLDQARTPSASSWLDAVVLATDDAWCPGFCGGMKRVRMTN